MSNYEPIFEPFYENGWENQPSENTPIMGEVLDAYDETLQNIELFLSNIDFSGIGSDYALLKEAGYSLNLNVDSNYVLTIDLLNKEGTILSSKNVDLPLETMFIDAKYYDGTIILTLQNGNTLDVNISDIVKGLVPTTRTIAGIDLEDDITKEELKNALGIYEGTESYSTDLEWGIAGFEADVITATPIGYVIPFNSCNDRSNIVFDAENHGFILRAGKTYELEATIRFIGSAGYKYFRFYDNINKVTRGISGGCEVATSSSYNDAITPVKLIVTPEVDTLYTIIVDTASNTTGNAMFILTTYFKVVELLENIFEDKDITETTSTTQPNSYVGREMVLEIGGVTEQYSTAGNQLFDASKRNVGLGVSTADGSLYPDSNMFSTDYIDVSNIDSIAWNGTSNESGTWGAFYDENKIFVGALGTNTFTVDIPSGASYVRLSFLNQYLDTAMVNAGTEALPYEPYTGGIPAPNPSYPMEIKKSVVKGVRTHWKNFINQACVSANKAGKHFLKAGTYTVTRDASEVGNSWYLGAYDSNNNVITENTLVAQGFEISSTKEYWFGGSIYATTTFTINVDCYVKIGVLNGSGKTYLMLNEGTTALPYEPYTESSYIFSQPIELYGKDGVQDVITPQNINRKFGVAVFDGSDDEGWSLSGSGNNYYTYANNGATSTHSRVISTHFMSGSWNVNEKNLICLGNNQSPVLGISASSFASLAELKEFLTSNPITVVYELATPTTEALPIADQMGLNSLLTYEGITYVEFIYEGLEPTFKGKYGTSEVGGMTLESLLVARKNELKQELANERLSALEASVVNNI